MSRLRQALNTATCYEVEKKVGRAKTEKYGKGTGKRPIGIFFIHYFHYFITNKGFRLPTTGHLHHGYHRLPFANAGPQIRTRANTTTY
jgi:hypothetical protein